MSVESDNTTVKGFLGKATALGREVVGAKIQDIEHYTGSGADDTKQGNDVACSEIMCMGHPDNTGKVWVRTNITATTDNAWPLDAGEVINFDVANLNELRMLIVADGESLIVAYA
jgi:hypothetical protein